MEQQIYEMLGHQFCSGNNITLDTTCKVEQVDASALIVPERLDLIAKYLYVLNVDKELHSDFLDELYDAHISALTHGICVEAGNYKKNSIDDYHACFDELIEAIRTNGFDSNKSVVPVGDDNIILDGAHRVAACAYFHKEVTVVRFNGLRFNFDYEYFKNEDLETTYLDTMALVYSILKKDTFVANVWPVAGDEKKLKEADAIIRKNTNVVFKKEIQLTYLGYRNYMLQIYSQHNWVGGFANHFKGITSKVDACYTGERNLTIYLFECDSLDSVLGLKDEIRELFKIGNHSIHISDNQTESVQMLELLLNRNSLNLLNYCEPDKFLEIGKLVSKRKENYSGNIDIAELSNMYFGDISLALYGICESEAFEKICIDDKDKSELIVDPENYVIYFGLKFIVLDQLIKIKKVENVDKIMIEKLEELNKIFKNGENKSLKILFNSKVRAAKRKLFGQIVMLARKLRVYDLVRSWYRKMRCR